MSSYEWSAGTVLEKESEIVSEATPEQLENFKREIEENVRLSFEGRKERSSSVIFEDLEEIKTVVSMIMEYYDLGLEKRKVLADIESTRRIKEESLFVSRIMETIGFVFDLYKQNPRGFELVMGRVRSEVAKNVEANELISYGFNDEDGELHFHINRSKELHLSPKEKQEWLFAKLFDGLVKMVEVVKEDPRVKVVSGTSPLVPKARRLLERIGFDVHINKDGDAGRCEMSREKFLRSEELFKNALDKYRSQNT